MNRGSYKRDCEVEIDVIEETRTRGGCIGAIPVLGPRHDDGTREPLDEAQWILGGLSEPIEHGERIASGGATVRTMASYHEIVATRALCTERGSPELAATASGFASGSRATRQHSRFVTGDPRLERERSRADAAEAGAEERAFPDGNGLRCPEVGNAGRFDAEHPSVVSVRPVPWTKPRRSGAVRRRFRAGVGVFCQTLVTSPK